jgi:uncharacterized protein
MSLKVNIRHLDAGDIHLDGELSPEEADLDCPDELVHARQPIYYDLTVQKSGQDVLAQGNLQFVLDCECARCLRPLKKSVELDDWAVLVPLEGPEKVEIKDDCLDLTPFVREDILLAFPQQPLCEADCAGLPNRADKNAKKAKVDSQAPVSPVWSELNKLKF